MANKQKTGYDRMFEAKMSDPEWATGYERARVRIERTESDHPARPSVTDQPPEVVPDGVIEPAKPPRRIHRWEDIKRKVPPKSPPTEP